MGKVFSGEVMRIRPYQALCLVCSQGGATEPVPGAPWLGRIRDAIGANPDQPLALCCKAGGIFAFQYPGRGEDTGEGPEFNLKRDLEILARLELSPGCVLPAWVVFKRLISAIPTTDGICAFRAAFHAAWQGCPRAQSGAYEKAVGQGLNALLPPRESADMERDKAQSLRDLRAATAIRIRPHILAGAAAVPGAVRSGAGGEGRLRVKFFPGEKQSQALQYAVLREGREEIRCSVYRADEGDGRPVPGRGRFHITPDNRLFVFFRVTGKDAAGAIHVENRLAEISAGGRILGSRPVPLAHPFTDVFTAIRLSSGGVRRRTLSVIHAGLVVCPAAIRRFPGRSRDRRLRLHPRGSLHLQPARSVLRWPGTAADDPA